MEQAPHRVRFTSIYQRVFSTHAPIHP